MVTARHFWILTLPNGWNCTQIFQYGWRNLWILGLLNGWNCTQIVHHGWRILWISALSNCWNCISNSPQWLDKLLIISTKKRLKLHVNHSSSLETFLNTYNASKSKSRCKSVAKIEFAKYLAAQNMWSFVQNSYTYLDLSNM